MPGRAFFRNRHSFDCPTLVGALELCAIFPDFDCETVRKEWDVDIEREDAATLPQFDPGEVELFLLTDPLFWTPS
jgi:hypothetical protein